MKNHKLYILLFLLTFIAFGAYGQNLFQGTIIDQATGEPMVGALILADDEGVASTGTDGKFDFQIAKIPSNFEITYVGYESLRLLPQDLRGIIRLNVSSTLINQVIVSASRDEKERAEAPMAISSIASQTLKETKPTRLDEVLNKVTGVYMVDLGNEQHTMSIRQPINYKGLFLYLEDGLPIRPAGVFNHNALLEMNMAALQRIEVIRGPSSSLYGSEAIGGAINFITLRPAAIPTARVGIQGNNNGYRRADFNASNTFGKVGVGVSGYYAKRKNGFREHSDFDKLALTARMDYIINDKNSLTLDATYIDFYTDMTGSLDSAFYYNKNYTSQHTFTNRKVDALRTKLMYNRYWNNNSKTTLALFARNNSIRQNPSYRVKDDYSPWQNPEGDKNLAHGEVNNNQVQSVGFVAQHRQFIDFLNGMNVTVGTSIDNSPNKFKANYISIVKSDDKIYTGFTETDSVKTDYRVHLLNIGAYANVDVRITEALQITAALRFDQLNFDFKNNLDENAFSGAPDDIDNFSSITPKLGATYNLGGGNGLFANYSRGILPPQVSELYRGVKIPSLKPAQYNNYEIGGWFQLFDRIALDVSLYQMNGKDEIITVRLDDGSRVKKNAGLTRHRGIEYGVNIVLLEGLKLRISGTNASHEFIDYVENKKSYNGNEMAQAPSLIANAELSYKPTMVPGLRLGLEVQHIDNYFMDNANTVKFKGYNIMNFRVGYEYKAFEIWTNVMNVTDALYATVARRSKWGDSYSVGEPRSFNVGLGYNFQAKK